MADSEDPLVDLLREHPEGHVAESEVITATLSAMLDSLAGLDVPDEDRPHVEWLPAFSTPARHVSIDQSMRHSVNELPERPSVVIKATPQQLRAHVDAHIEWAIQQKVEEGELERVDKGEK